MFAIKLDTDVLSSATLARRSTYVLASARVRMCACMFAWPEYNGIELAGELVSVGFGWCAKSVVEILRSRFRRKKHCNGTS